MIAAVFSEVTIATATFDWQQFNTWLTWRSLTTVAQTVTHIKNTCHGIYLEQQSFRVQFNAFFIWQVGRPMLITVDG